ncbi:sensor histidine kinase [Thalassotalea sp. PLHSN55]|uniref:sensor histidine kinase n=1 Tax=Thalassotalea sp. PLHSN55 TaxID=3435888 RepID=UPI003F84985B
MSNKPKKFHSLSRRIVAQFCIFTLFLSAIFGFLAFILLYNLEDSFIERDIDQEAQYLVNHYQQNQQWPAVRSAYFSLHFSTESLPKDMRETFIAEPQRKEFYGEAGRHYHLLTLSTISNINNVNNAYLLAEVSQKLLVRPVREGIFKLLIISALMLTVIAFIIAWLLGRKTAKPLKDLADLVDGVAPENIPNTFADKFPNNEIGILAQTLEHSMQQISKALERERCFTRDVSHELRTPVAVIKNSVELFQQKNNAQTADSANKAALNKESANRENTEIVSRIGEAAVQMEQTVTTLLLLAREEHAQAKQTLVPLLPLIEQSIIEQSYLLEGKSVDVQVDDNCAVSVMAQQGMLKVLLDNLLSNAFQYTEQGKVIVSFNDNTLTIEDTGPGIEKDISQQVTEPAIKGSQSTGYGFGLSIVKRLCENQQWQLTVVSEQGTRISIGFN